VKLYDPENLAGEIFSFVKTLCATAPSAVPLSNDICTIDVRRLQKLKMIAVYKE